ncbi:MAG: hypothetical protein DRP78_04420 [Candidatus Omnitrophota bacterium]|nr:MAG: hypothetical protein DRP78_04420 [Candidatus Omnitrophota bacterium]
MRKIKILYIIRSLTLSGAEIAAVNLALNLNQERYEVAVCAFESGTLIDALKKNSIPVFIYKRRMRYDLLLLWKIIVLLKQLKVDIVHSYAFQTHCYAFPAVKITGTRFFIMSEHGNIENQLGKKRRCYLNKLFMSFADAIITVSNSYKRQLVKLLAAPAGKITVVYNGVDLEHFSVQNNNSQLKNCLGISRDEHIVINISNLLAVKNHSSFLHAAANVLKQMPNVKFLLVGSGPLRNVLEKEADGLEISKNILFMGWRSDIIELLNISDLMAMSSSYETFCISAAEAMAAEKPVVLTNVGGVGELVENGITGILVTLNDSKEMAKQILRLLKNKKLAAQMGRAGRKRIKDNFSLKVMVKNTTQIYQQLIK